MGCWEWEIGHSVTHQVAIKNAAPINSTTFGNQYRYPNVRPTIQRTLKGRGFTSSEETALYAKSQLRHTDSSSTLTGTDNLGNSFSIKMLTYQSVQVEGTGLWEITITTDT